MWLCGSIQNFFLCRPSFMYRCGYCDKLFLSVPIISQKSLHNAKVWLGMGLRDNFFCIYPKKHEDKNSTNTYSKLAEIIIYVYYNVSMKLKRV